MRKVVATVAGVLAVLAVFVQPAVAANPTGRGSGTQQFTNFVQTQIGTVGGDTYYTYTETDVTTGVITGSPFTAGTYVLHPDGSWKGASTSICTACSIAGRTGDFAITWEVSGSSVTTLSGKAISVDSSGGLQGLELTMQLVSSDGISGTYTASYRFGK